MANWARDSNNNNSYLSLLHSRLSEDGDKSGEGVGWEHVTASKLDQVAVPNLVNMHVQHVLAQQKHSCVEYHHKCEIVVGQ